MVRFRFAVPAAIALLAACSSAPPPAPAPTPALPPAATPAPAASIGTVTVTASALNVRRDPSTTGDVIAMVRRGQRLTLLASTESWMKVRMESGENGWVSSQHVTRDGAAPKPSARPRKGGCQADSDYAFATTPVPVFSDSGAHGLVVVEADVDTSGRVTSTRLVSNSTGDEALGFLTQKEIKGAKFVAPIRNCVPRAFIFTYKRTF
jgi:TonB family protein